MQRKHFLYLNKLFNKYEKCYVSVHEIKLGVQKGGFDFCCLVVTDSVFLIIMSSFLLADLPLVFFSVTFIVLRCKVSFPILIIFAFELGCIPKEMIVFSSISIYNLSDSSATICLVFLEHILQDLKNIH